MLAAPIQTTLDLGIPLHQVTFCVVDLETTGGSPADCRITEVGAVKYLGGERIGSFQALVNPEIPIPPFITHLTGIDDRLGGSRAADRGDPPGVPRVLPGRRLRRPQRPVRLLVPEREPHPARLRPVARLRPSAPRGWLAAWSGPTSPTSGCRRCRGTSARVSQPNHRAFADAEACAEVLHGLLDLGGRLGILTLGDLHEAVRARGKVALRQDRPGRPPAARSRRVPVPRPRRPRAVRRQVQGPARARQVVLLRRRAQEGRRPALRDDVDRGRRAAGPRLEALVAEARLIHRHEPKYNRRGKTWRRYAYLKIDPAEAFPRLKIVRAAAPGDGCTYLGPFGSSGAAKLAKEADRRDPAGPPVHDGDGRADAVRAVRPGRHGPVRRSVRRPRRSRALRRARPEARLLPDLPGRAPRSARTTHGPPRRAGTLRGGGARAGPAARAGRRPGAQPGRRVARGRRRAHGPRRRRDRPFASATVRWSAATMPNRSPPRAPGSAPTSSRPCAAGSARTTRGVESCDRPLAEPVDGGAAIARIQAQVRAAGESRT